MTQQKKKVLITGASGLIGGLALKNLSDKYEFSALNRRAMEGIPCVQADISDADAIQSAFEGIDTVLHLSAYTEDVYEWDWKPPNSFPARNRKACTCTGTFVAASSPTRCPRRSCSRTPAGVLGQGR